jgi:transcription antitermination factor NusG
MWYVIQIAKDKQKNDKFLDNLKKRCKDVSIYDCKEMFDVVFFFPSILKSPGVIINNIYEIYGFINIPEEKYDCLRFIEEMEESSNCRILREVVKNKETEKCERIPYVITNKQIIDIHEYCKNYAETPKNIDLKVDDEVAISGDIFNGFYGIIIDIDKEHGEVDVQIYNKNGFAIKNLPISDVKKVVE